MNAGGTNVSGGCHCGNLTFAMQLTATPNSYRPRACDCDFCSKHAAVYVSDPNGSVTITIHDDAAVSRYRQGSQQVDLLLCRHCGVMVAVTYLEHGRLYGAVNARAVDGSIRFGEELSVSPKMLSAVEKSQRWQGLWFSNVSITRLKS